MIELGEKVATLGQGPQGEQKTIKQFFKASDLKPEQVIEGIYKGTFESKKTEGYRFHVFEDKAGDVYGYGQSVALDGKVEEIKKKLEELGTDNLYYAIFKYEGKFKNKGDPKKTTHRFSHVELIKVLNAAHTGSASRNSEAPVTTDDIPF